MLACSSDYTTLVRLRDATYELWTELEALSLDEDNGTAIVTAAGIAGFAPVLAALDARDAVRRRRRHRHPERRRRVAALPELRRRSRA